MRHYSEQEIQAIFRRATERQEAASTQAPREGLTLDELKRIGDESGIDPAHIEAAAHDITHGVEGAPSPTGVERFYGRSATIQVERMLPGRMDDAIWNDAVETLRSIFNTRGQAETIGPIREWSAFTSSGFDYQALLADDTWYTMMEGLNLTSNKTRSPVHVEAKPEGGGTRLTATYRMPPSRLWEGPGISAVFLLAAIVTTIVFTLNASPLALFLVPLGLLLGGGSAAAYYYHMHRSELETTQQRIDKAVERIALLQAANSMPAGSNTQADFQADPQASPPRSIEIEEEQSDDISSSPAQSASRHRSHS